MVPPDSPPPPQDISNSAATTSQYRPRITIFSPHHRKLPKHNSVCNHSCSTQQRTLSPLLQTVHNELPLGTMAMRKQDGQHHKPTASFFHVCSPMRSRMSEDGACIESVTAWRLNENGA
jgi:hypothetical protein